MKKAFLREHGKSGIELAEEAFVLLRSCPPAILAAYYVGSVPFAAGFLIFCSDLGGRPGADHRLGGATLAMTGLFIWMKFFQARFAGMLLARLRGMPPAPYSPGAIFHSLSVQTIAHATALFVVPLAAIAVLPFAWVYAFYQNLSALDDGKTGLRDLVRSAWKQAILWPAQNHILLTVLSLFGLYVLINWATLGLLAPQLLKMFSGIESVFTHSPLSMLNTTFLAAVAFLTFLSLDPLLKACYVLRCFYGKSLQSGDDLKTEVRRFSGRLAALTSCLLLCLGSPSLLAREPVPPPPVTEAALDRSIATVIQQEKYTWRTPPEKSPEKGGWLEGLFKSMARMIEGVFKTLSDLIQKIIGWFFPHGRRAPAFAGDIGWLTAQNVLLFAILALMAGGLALTTMRIIRRRRRTALAQTSAIAIVPDLEDESTAADELPEDGWTRLGRRFLEQGDPRLALRAFYLASLSHLAARGLITIAPYKSNRDYERELGRRGHVPPGIRAHFGENVGIFERIWYGFHEVSPSLVEHFVANLEKIKAAA